jgi:hypothetical protein
MQSYTDELVFCKLREFAGTSGEVSKTHPASENGGGQVVTNREESVKWR